MAAGLPVDWTEILRARAEQGERFALAPRNGAAPLIGAGFGLGPAAGLLAAAIEPSFHSYTLAILVGVGPLILTCSIGAVWHGAKVVFPRKQS
jgi:hypothetical protein